ncbi:thioredoxin-like protein [Hyaloraphidium curvatum]|nr:thioredoxin-like protein [Hyaloraphidium curvatum]
MKLLNSNMSPYCSRVRGVLYAKGIPCEIVNNSKEVKALNPLGKIPTLVLDNGDVIIESEICTEYLDKAFPGPSFTPKDPVTAAKSATVSRIVDLYMSPLFNTFWTPKVPQEQVDKAITDLSKYLDIIEGMIVGPYVTGNQMTLADWSLGGVLPMTTIFWQRKKFDAFAGRPKLGAWYKKMHEDAAFQKMKAEIEGSFKPAAKV